MKTIHIVCLYLVYLYDFYSIGLEILAKTEPVSLNSYLDGRSLGQRSALLDTPEYSGATN